MQLRHALKGIGVITVLSRGMGTPNMSERYLSIWKKNSTNELITNFVFQKMKEGVIVLNHLKQIVYVNPSAESITHFKESELLGETFSVLFPNPKNDYRKIWSNIYINDHWNGEIVKLRQSGNQFVAKTNIYALKNEDLITTNYVVMFQDISEQKQSSFELDLAFKIIENTNEGVAITDNKGLILSVNPAFEVVTGYANEEVIGKNPRILKSGIHKTSFYKHMWKDISESEFWKGEIWNRRKNGEIYPEWLNISAIKDENGTITNYVAVFSDITDRKKVQQKLNHFENYDVLTGLPNRILFNKRSESLIEGAKRHNQQIAVLFLDLDRFKYINEMLGHSSGDLLLKEVASRLKGKLTNKDTIARLGGDEFVIVLPTLKHVKEAIHVAESIIDTLRSPFQLNGQEAYVSASIGISFFPFDGDHSETLLTKAERAMYEAKEKGRNRFELFYNDLTINENQYIKLENNLRKAVERQELQLHYHPQIDLNTKCVCGVEALLRWKQKELGFVPPSEFIPLAEETGLIIPISEWIIRTACEEIKKVQVNDFPTLRVSINISGIHFQQANFVSTIKSIIQDTNIDPRLVELELTESMIMPDAEDSIEKLVRLKQLGVKISIDDFGTGYSSLSYLNRFPIDSLKIDQSFIQNLTKYQDDASIVSAIITMAHQLRLKVVAEGVESKKQLILLTNSSCDIAQGFFICKPLPFGKLQGFLDDWDPTVINYIKLRVK